MKIKTSQDFREADLTLCKKGDRHSQPYHAEPGISIHALRVEGDITYSYLYVNTFLFQSTPSVWRATTVAAGGMLKMAISIHALRVEGDTGGKWLGKVTG